MDKEKKAQSNQRGLSESNHRFTLGLVTLKDGGEGGSGGILKHQESRHSISNGNAEGRKQDVDTPCLTMVDWVSDVTGSVGPKTASVLFSRLTKAITTCYPRGCLSFILGDLFQPLYRVEFRSVLLG